MKFFKILFLTLLSLVVLNSCDEHVEPEVVPEGDAVLGFSELTKTVAETETTLSIPILVEEGTAPTGWSVTFNITVEPTDAGVVLTKSTDLTITEADKSVNMVMTLALDNDVFEEDRVYRFTIEGVNGKDVTLDHAKKTFILTVTNDDTILTPSLITANCFIVAPSGSVDVPINNVNMFWGKGGDGAIATEMGDTWSEPNLEAPAVVENLITYANYVAEVIWSDIPEGVDVSFAKTATHFTVSNIPATSGNIVVGVKKAGAGVDDPYLWSWHLWVTDFDPNAGAATLPNGEVVMDRNLGATNATSSDVGALGLLYQWGRKDPFPGAKSIKDNIVRATYPTALPDAVEGGVGTLLKIIEKPNVFYGGDMDKWDVINTGHLSQDKGYNRWGETTGQTVITATKGTKSIYDPCPDGWRMPWGENWSGFSVGSNESLLDFKLHIDGWAAKSGRVYTTGGKTIWFPASGYRHPGTGSIAGVSIYGYYWSAMPSSATYGYYLYFTANNVLPSINSTRSRGFSVRPMKDVP